jgi:chromosome segregation ATPase
MSFAEAAAPTLAYDSGLDPELVERLRENEKILKAEVMRLRCEAEAMETELTRALDLARARIERGGLTRRIAQLEAELGPAVLEHGRMAARIQEMDRELQQRDREHQRLSLQIRDLDAALQERDRRIRRMRASLSWRLGAPLRALQRPWAQPALPLAPASPVLGRNDG